MKQYHCVQVGHHKDIRSVCAQYLEQGWQLLTYQASGSHSLINHYLLFERDG